MKTISANTKISALIKENPGCIDVIATINPHFKKLQNPFLRKILASRVTIKEAARIGGCEISSFFEKLKPLGFVINDTEASLPDEEKKISSNIHPDYTLDVRQDIESGKAPFRKIMDAVSALKAKEVLLLINSFEPLPLIRILLEKGFEIDVENASEGKVHTYIKKMQEAKIVEKATAPLPIIFQQKLKAYKDNLVIINVRALPMPQPMMRILEALPALSENEALFVFHKKVPLFLLPELKEKLFEYVYQETQEGVELLIFKNKTENASA
jgi:uncharacterized protein (DUF2249 family)